MSPHTHRSRRAGFASLLSLSLVGAGLATLAGAAPASATPGDDGVPKAGAAGTAPLVLLAAGLIAAGALILRRRMAA